MTLLDRLRDVGCNRQPFTPEHADCICRLTNEAANEIERLAATIPAIIKDVCELDGYTSPDDNPDLLQCTVKELELILRRHLLGEDDAPREELPNCVWRGAATPFADNH